MIGNKTDCIKFLVDQADGEYEVKEYRRKRSLTANGYYHALLHDLAAALRTTADELHPQLIMRYSVVDEDLPPITIKAWADATRLPGYWKLVKSDGTWNAYIRIKGSSEMNSKEFSRLLDGLIEECKEVGVETLPPYKVKELKDYVA